MASWVTQIGGKFLPTWQGRSATSWATSPFESVWIDSCFLSTRDAWVLEWIPVPTGGFGSPRCCYSFNWREFLLFGKLRAWRQFSQLHFFATECFFVRKSDWERETARLPHVYKGLRFCWTAYTTQMIHNFQVLNVNCSFSPLGSFRIWSAGIFEAYQKHTGSYVAQKKNHRFVDGDLGNSNWWQIFANLTG